MSTPEPLPNALPTLLVSIFSFGYRNGGPPLDDHGHRGGFVFDCRALPNPYWDERLRTFSGLTDPLRNYFASHASVARFSEHAGALVLEAAREYTRLGREHLMVAFGCTGGKHRSVFLAAELAASLRKEGFRVRLCHRDTLLPS